VLRSDPTTEIPKRIGFADPPYPGLAHYYRDHPDYAGEVDHGELIRRLERDYDGWVLHTSSPALGGVLAHVAAECAEPPRVMAWVKPFASFKPSVPVAYAWEPMLVKACRKPVVSGRVVLRDWYAENITMRRGFVGAKPEALCRWLFEVLGAEPEDELDDMFPGSGAVGRAWEVWRGDVLYDRGQPLPDDNRLDFWEASDAAL
jgi:hypothetical protein